MPSQKKKVRVISQAKKTSKDAKKKTASDGISKARKSLEDAREVKAQREARQKELQKSLAAASEEEAKAMKMEIDTIENELQQTEQKLQAAQAEEARFKKDEEDADNEDEYSDMEVDDEIDPDKPLDSIETETETGIDPTDIVEKLMQGVRLSDPAEVTDITKDALLRPKQKVTCYKDGFGKPAIVVDCEIPKWIIYRIRKDVLIPENCPNFMTWRRAGVVKDPTTKKKWSVDDISKVQGIAIEVPPGYDKDPEELVRLIPKLSGAQKDKLKKKGKPIPKQPDVQLLIEWKAGMMVEDGTGKPKKRFTSWESRSGCRTLWKKHRIADAFLLEVAMKREGGYRNAGGRHSSEVRSMSPIDIPRAGSTPASDEEEEDTENEVTDSEEEKAKEKEKEKRRKKEEEKKKKEAEEEKKREEEKKKKEKEDEKVEGKGGFDASDYKAASDQFELRFRARKGIAADVELTAIQEGDLIEAFEYVWAKRQAEKRGSKL